jgi:hypothetical protein
MLVLFCLLYFFMAHFCALWLLACLLKAQTQASHPNTAYGNMQEEALHSSLLKIIIKI